ncbi:hypothetical protein CAPTEDRAFT_185335 [Capitella teleta]|uniref:Uncharacterized protein n=1 Tax=Capitella teleta TaxID=283909 RepID=R7U3J1_CAPTE|nr:hypothetical protein CAPTEDRAFT_185335 [Capitella teleta]|eukprot:ELU00534.1 hypothetical protein CAPTEDRAFT_185335 [Capitella teleta]
MARELGVLAEYQCAQVLLSSVNATLAFDATTQEGRHCNAIILTSESKTLVLAVDELPGGSGRDYATHVMDTIHRLAVTYAYFTGQDVVETESQLIANIANTMTDRYKDSKGDPRGFMLFLLNKKFPLGLLPSLRAAIVSDYSSDTAKVQLQIAGLIGKLITCPWMRRFYGNRVSYVQGIEDVRRVVATCKAAQPCNLLSWTTDCFGDQLEQSTTLAALQLQPDPELLPGFVTAMKASLDAIVLLLERQFKRQFDEPVAGLVETTESAHTNNIACKELMGMLSASLQRAPSATISYHSAKICAQKLRLFSV